MKLQKETSPSESEFGGEAGQIHGKWYGDACGAAFAMELIGERWSIMIVRELMLGPLRFGRIRANLPGISAKVLTERLARLEQAGVLIRRTLPQPGEAQVYELTEWGKRVEPALQELARWALMSSGHDPSLPITPTAMMLSLRTMIDRQAAAGLRLSVAFVFPDDCFLARLDAGDLAVSRGPDRDAEADLTFAALDPAILLPVFYGDMPIESAEQDLGLTLKGDRDIADRFARLFALPEKCA